MLGEFDFPNNALPEVVVCVLGAYHARLLRSLGRERLRGTIGYMAPEIIVRRQYTPAADVWASGVVLYILLVGYPPFHSASNR